MARPLLTISNCLQMYDKSGATDVPILDGVSFDVLENEILGLIGRPGSGKSTLLRIAAGLLSPSSGCVFWKGEALTEPTTEIAMVFQSYALFPWLSVRANISLGLEAKRLARSEQERLCDEVIDLSGLTGYENALPKELSDAMQQRVSLARALVMQPDLLLLDEPFSSLDLLTAGNLRTDLIELWSENKLSTRSMMIATHNVEEAVLMCDRILLFLSNPGRVSHELKVPLPHPRNRHDATFRAFVDHIYTLMTRRSPIISEATLDEKDTATAPQPSKMLILSPVSISSLTGLLETLYADPLDGRADLPHLSEQLQMTVDNLFPICETLHLLGLAELEDGDLLITEVGSRFAVAEHDERREIIRGALLHQIPLIRNIRAVLDEHASHRSGAHRFREELTETMSPSYAEQTLTTATNWARYTELFDFDEETDQFMLNHEAPNY